MVTNDCFGRKIFSTMFDTLVQMFVAVQMYLIICGNPALPQTRIYNRIQLV